jgi:peptidoglycan/LPS O-acetylase OafA/YrhL
MILKSIDGPKSSFYKGVGILLIVIHNFMILVKDTPGHNEFDFDPERFQLLIRTLQEAPEEVFRLIPTYLGHFGVHIFIFLSAYGLTKKYLHAPPNFLPFIKSRVKKLYLPFLLAVVGWMVITTLFKGPTIGGEIIFSALDSILFKLLLISPFMAEHSLYPEGPWWFIPFIMQFYLIFPLMIRGFAKWGGAFLVILAAISYLISYLTLGGPINLYLSVIPHLPQLCLGIYLASKNREVSIPSAITISALTLFILSNIYPLIWPLGILAALILLLTMLEYLYEKTKGITVILSTITFYGGISMYLFFINSYLRQPMLAWAQRANSWTTTLSYSLLFLAIITVGALIFQWVNRKIATSF